jgi:hypothetical protein
VSSPTTSAAAPPSCRTSTVAPVEGVQHMGGMVR